MSDMLICVFVFSCTHLFIINIHHTVIRQSQNTLNPDVHAEMEEVLRSFYCDLSTVKVEILQSEMTKLQVSPVFKCYFSRSTAKSNYQGMT